MSFDRSSWFLRMLGFDTESLPPGAEPRLTWTNLPQSWEVFLVLGVALAFVYIVGFFYWREIDTCSRRVKVLLAALRSAVLLTLVAIFLGPAITYTEFRRIPPRILVLRDASESMRMRDRYLDKPTADAVAAALGLSPQEFAANQSTDPKNPPRSRAQIVDVVLTANDRALLSELRQRGRVSFVDFPKTVRGESAGNGDKTAKEEPKTEADYTPLADVVNGQTTDITRAVQGVLSERNLGAVVLFTDGQHTEKSNPLAAAERAKQLGVPLLIVGLGDPTPRRNLEISKVVADDEVWKNSRFEIQAVLRAEGYAGEDVQVQLIELDQPKGAAPNPENTKTITIPPTSGQVTVSFPRTVDRAGQRRYSVRVLPKADEVDKDDNQPRDPKIVTVLDNQARVLLIAGGPSWEYRGIQRRLQEEESINLSCWMQSIAAGRAQEGNTIITQLPTTKQELLQYDVILLVDPDPKDFDENLVANLIEFVNEHARGILYMTGTKFTGRFLSDQPTRKLREIMPVTFGDVQALEVTTLLATNTVEWRVGVVRPNVDHPIMKFFPERQATIDLWESLPGIYWSFPTKTTKPGARVLLEHTDPTLKKLEGPRPLLVTRRYGAGRTVYLGFNGTWRWKRVGLDSEFFNRFWIQTVRYLTEGRLVRGKRRGFITTDRSEYRRNDTIVIEAFLNDPAFKPLKEKSVEAFLRFGDDAPRKIALNAVANRPGEYRTEITARQLGTHELQVILPGTASSASSVSTTFTVEPPQAELRQRNLNKKFLQSLATASGGRYFEPNELSELPDAIKKKPSTIKVDGETSPIWDTAFLIGVLVVLLAAEWATRKYFKLV